MKLRSTEILLVMMKDRHFSMARLARYSGCSKGMISHLCAGRKTSCSKELADNIAEALGVPTSVIFVERTSADSGRPERTERMAS